MYTEMERYRSAHGNSGIARSNDNAIQVVELARVCKRFSMYATGMLTQAKLYSHEWFAKVFTPVLPRLLMEFDYNGNDHPAHPRPIKGNGLYENLNIAALHYWFPQQGVDVIAVVYMEVQLQCMERGLLFAFPTIEVFVPAVYEVFYDQSITRNITVNEVQPSELLLTLKAYDPATIADGDRYGLIPPPPPRLLEADIAAQQAHQNITKYVNTTTTMIVDELLAQFSDTEEYLEYLKTTYLDGYNSKNPYVRTHSTFYAHYVKPDFSTFHATNIVTAALQYIHPQKWAGFNQLRALTPLIVNLHRRTSMTSLLDETMSCHSCSQLSCRRPFFTQRILLKLYAPNYYRCR